MAVATLGDEAYGLGVRREVSEMRGRDCSVGAIAIAAELGRPFSGTLELALLNRFWIVPFLISAVLFRRTAGTAHRAEAAA